MSNRNGHVCEVTKQKYKLPNCISVLVCLLFDYQEMAFTNFNGIYRFLFSSSVYLSSIDYETLLIKITDVFIMLLKLFLRRHKKKIKIIKKKQILFAIKKKFARNTNYVSP